MVIGVDTRTASAAAEGRSSFVDYVLNDFVAETRIAVSDEVRDFILAHVLKSDDAWAKGVRKRAFDPDQTRRILTDALDAAAKRQFGYSVPGGAELDISSVGTSSKGAFYEVIHNYWKCPFPFIFC